MLQFHNILKHFGRFFVAVFTEFETKLDVCSLTHENELKRNLRAELIELELSVY
jgi:hypothetical protein